MAISRLLRTNNDKVATWTGLISIFVYGYQLSNGPRKLNDRFAILKRPSVPLIANGSLGSTPAFKVTVFDAGVLLDPPIGRLTNLTYRTTVSRSDYGRSGPQT